MRYYQPDSPEALGRILALALLVDGGLDKSEMEKMEKDAIIEQLGLTKREFDSILHDFCDDLLITSMRDSSGQIGLGRETIDLLLADIRNHDLQLSILHILLDMVKADGRVTPGEAVLISQAMSRWGLELTQPSTSYNLTPQQKRHFTPRGGISFNHLTASSVR